MALLRELIQPAQLERCGDRSFPVLSMTMHDGIMLQSDRFKKSLASVDQSAYKVVRRNQLVVGFPIDEGVLYIQQVVDAGIMSPAYDVWNVDETKVDLRYFELCLHSPQSMMFYKTNLRGTTARRRSLPKETLLSLPVPVPSMERQREIASALDRLQALIRLRQHQLCAIDQLIKARFVEMFGDPIINDRGWQQITLLESLEAGRTVTYGIVQTGDEFEGGIPVFRPIDIAGGHVPKRDELKKTDPLISAQYKRTLLKGNELLITVRGSVGETFQTTEEFEGCNVGRNIVPLVTDSNKVCQRFLQELFAQDAIKNWLKGITKGIALQGLNMGEFKEMPVVMPPLAMQKVFVDFALQVDKSKVVELSVFTKRAKSYII